MSYRLTETEDLYERENEKCKLAVAVYRNGFCHKFIVACHILSYIECTNQPVLKAVNFFKPSSSILACNYTQKRVVGDAGYSLEFLVTNPVQTRESSGLGTKIDNE